MGTQAKFDAMAGILSEIGTEVEALGEVLCRNQGFAAQHMRELQAIDMIAQKQRALAAILSAGLCEKEIRKISIMVGLHLITWKIGVPSFLWKQASSQTIDRIIICQDHRSSKNSFES